MRNHCMALWALALVCALPVAAQDNDAYLAGWQADFDRTSQKLNDLAAAFPDEMYGWRPAEGVRSVGEVCAHVVQANYALSGILGAESPADFPQDVEQSVTGKDDLLMWLEKSQDHVRKAGSSTASEDLTGTVEAFGQTWSKYDVLTIIGGHSHEHLGQLIAYARMNGVEPPWSGE